MVRTEQSSRKKRDRQPQPGRDWTETVERIVAREVERLQGRASSLESRLQKLLEAYESARRLVEDVESVAEAHRRFASAIEETDWSRRRRRIGDQLTRVLTEWSDQSDVVLAWDRQRGLFYADGDRPVWRARRQSPTIEVAAIVEEGIEVAPDAEAVGYPIVFTHELESNHRAVLQAVGWALVAGAAGRRLGETGGVERIRLGRGDEQLKLSASTATPVFGVPEPEAFGYDAEGELLRRLRDFDQRDPDAHRVRWLQRADRAPRELRVMRDRNGAGLRVEVDRRLRRLRVIERPASEIVRNRAHVFVEEAAARTRDRLFGDQEVLDRATREVIGERIEEGYRVVYERLEFEDGVEERGREP